MLDVHVLTLPGLPAEWIEQRRASIANAIAHAGFPVEVHEVEGERGHLGRSRRRGYAQGAFPYVTHVDHDDYLLPDAFAVLAPHMEAGADAITTGERLLLEDGTTRDRPDGRHHLAVYRRDAIWWLPFDRMAHHPDQFLLARFEPVHHVPECVYVHRVFGASASRECRRADPSGAAFELEAIKRPELFAIESMTPAQVAGEYDRILADG